MVVWGEIFVLGMILLLCWSVFCLFGFCGRFEGLCLWEWHGVVERVDVLGEVCVFGTDIF